MCVCSVFVTLYASVWGTSQCICQSSYVEKFKGKPSKLKPKCNYELQGMAGELGEKAKYTADSAVTKTYLAIVETVTTGLSNAAAQLQWEGEWWGVRTCVGMWVTE